MLKRYLEYIKDNPQGYWFKAKPFGWGWTPARVQGWVVLLLFIVGIYANLYRLNLFSASNENKLFEFGYQTIIMVVVLIFICYKKGEKPRWNWGWPKSNKIDKDKLR